MTYKSPFPKPSTETRIKWLEAVLANGLGKTSKPLSKQRIAHIKKRLEELKKQLPQ